MNHSEIKKLCKKYDIENYTINEDGSIDVGDGVVDLSRRGLTKIPLKFNIVIGDFYCYNNPLISLEGAPTECCYFYCDNIEELWNKSSDVFKVLYQNIDWVRTKGLTI